MKSRNVQKIIIILGLIFVVIIWQIVTLFLENRPVTNYPPKGNHIIVLGDSVSVGIGASSPERGFIPILAQRLNVPIINKSISGNTSRDGLLRLERDVLSEKPDIVIVLLGGNDYLKKIPEQETFSNLHSIITQIQSQGAIVLLLGIRGGLLVDHFESGFNTLAKKTGSVYVPNVLDGIIGNATLVADEIHPNDKGYEKIADKVAPSLMGLVSAVPTLPTRE